MADPSLKRRLALTRHAANAVIDRKLEIEWLDRTVNDADASVIGSGRTLYAPSKVIPESDGACCAWYMCLRVRNVARVLTVFFDRGRRK